MIELEKQQMIDFIIDVLNHFAVNLSDGIVDWRDYFDESDIEKWLEDRKNEPKSSLCLD